MRRLRRRARQPEYSEQNEPYPSEFDPATTAEDEGDFLPFVPVSRRYDEQIDEGEAEVYAPDEESRRRRVRLPRPRIGRPSLGIEIRFGVLLAAILLIVGGIFGTLLNLDRISGEVADWWPAALLAVAVLWMGAALIRRRVASFLGASAFLGVGLSLLMDTQRVADANDTIVGIVLITVGLGIVMRGFLLRGQASA
jgi:hypothetical protein